MISPVNLELDRVIDGQKFESCNVWYVLRTPQSSVDEGSKPRLPFGERVAEIIETFPLLDHHVIDVKQSDLLGLVKAMAGIVKAELAIDTGVEFVFNVSSSTRTAAYAIMLVAGCCPAPVKILYLRPKEDITLMEIVASKDKTLDEIRQNLLEHGEAHSPFTAEYYPVIPFATFTPTERAILARLATNRLAESVSSLVQAIAPETKAPSRKDLVKVGWSVKALERMHLVTSSKANHSRMIVITPEGEVVAAASTMISD